MRNQGLLKWLVMSLTAFMLQACIHEYPHATNIPATPPGNDPTAVSTYIEVNYELSWENIFHQLVLSTRGVTERHHRVIIEVRDNGETICRDVYYLSEEEFSQGRLRHRLSRTLGNKEYDIAAWYDYEDENGNYPYLAETLDRVCIDRFSTVDAENMRCGYAFDKLDLREFASTDKTETFIKVLDLEHPVARIEIVATDVLKFIDEQQEALYQGDTFTASLTLGNGGGPYFDIFGNRVWREENHIEHSGRMRLPFAEYDKLKIAEGVIFCNREEELVATLRIRNSSLLTVSFTDEFTIPVKRGFITVVEGDFLTHPVDGIFSVNNIWNGEISYESGF